MFPHFFLSGFVFGEVSKPNMTFVTFCVKSFSCSITGAIWWGTRGTCPPAFQVGGYDMPCLPLFLFRFCIWRSSKNESDVGHVLCETLFMLNVTHSQSDVETEFGVVLLDSVSLSILALIK